MRWLGHIWQEIVRVRAVEREIEAWEMEFEGRRKSFGRKAPKGTGNGRHEVGWKGNRGRNVHNKDFKGLVGGAVRLGIDSSSVEACRPLQWRQLGMMWSVKLEESEAVQSHKCEMARQSFKADHEILNSGDNGPTWCDAANVRDG